jgi:hypothetical protein
MAKFGYCGEGVDMRYASTGTKAAAEASPYPQTRPTSTETTRQAQRPWRKKHDDYYHSHSCSHEYCASYNDNYYFNHPDDYNLST